VATENTGEKKNRPTPKRKAAEAKNKVNSLAPATNKEERAAARNMDRSRRAELRAAYMRGDESVLPARDKGPVRRFVRDYVDSRRMPGEYIFYLLFASIFFSFLAPHSSKSGHAAGNGFQVIVVMIMYIAVIVLIAHALILRHQIVKAVREKFPDTPTRGLGMYAFMRSTQIRRLRAPSPQVSPKKGRFSKKGQEK
jgi:Protein of unknown function (DUF3043)